MKSARGVFAIGVIVVGVITLLPGKVALAQGLPPGQLPTLTGEWWQWVLSIPNSVSPILAATGERWMYDRSTGLDMVSGRHLRDRVSDTLLRRPIRSNNFLPSN